MEIEGTYRLVSCEVRWSDGEVDFPYGKTPEGLLVYTTTGYVTGHLMRPDIPRLRTGARRAPAEETRAAFLGYLGYYGTYTVDERACTVTHRVLGSWHPNWVGTDQVRYFRFEGGMLVIETPPIPSGCRSYRTRLVWNRTTSAGLDPTGETVY